MTDLKEKLAELLVQGRGECSKIFCKDCEYYTLIGKCKENMVADHLIANGVTVQKEAKLYWKPVRPGVWNLTCSACDSHLGCREDSKFCPECGAKFVKHIALTPELPEEVE